MVPAHLHSLSQPRFRLRLFSLVLLFLFALQGAHPVLGQFLVNGQVFTAALAIVDAPAPQSTYHAGSNIPIAIDVSGNGKLGQDASAPGSGLSTHYNSLELYLISTQTDQNVTISSGTAFLAQEPSSTVKHLDFQLSRCVPAGSYNFTVYEGSRINDTDFFSISAIPVSVENTDFNGTCTEGVNALQDLPQASSPPPQQPFIDTNTLTPLDVSYNNDASASLAPTQAGAQTVTLTLGPTGVNTMPGGSTPSAVTVTVLLVAVDTVISTLPGRTVGFTTVVTTTQTAIVTSAENDSNFIPVNSHTRSSPSSLLPLLWVSSLLCIFILRVII